MCMGHFFIFVGISRPRSNRRHFVLIQGGFLARQLSLHFCVVQYCYWEIFKLCFTSKVDPYHKNIYFFKEVLQVLYFIVKFNCGCLANIRNK